MTTPNELFGDPEELKPNQLLPAIRDMPAECDFCGKKTEPEKFIAQFGDQWMCEGCWDRLMEWKGPTLTSPTEGLTMTKHDKQAKGNKLNDWLDAGITKVITSLAENSQSRLLALDESEITGEWYWRWEEVCSVEWNTYEFSDSLEMYKRRCGQWEEHHNGICCVVERVRDKYLMPRVKSFLAELKAHSA